MHGTNRPQATPGNGATLKSLYGDNCYYADSSWKRMHRSPETVNIYNILGGGGGCDCGCGGGFGWLRGGSFGFGFLNGICDGIWCGLMNFVGCHNLSFQMPWMNCGWQMPWMGGGFQMPWMSGGFQMPWLNSNTNTDTNNDDKGSSNTTIVRNGNKDTDKQSEFTTRIDDLCDKAIREETIPTADIDALIDEIDDIINKNKYEDDVQNDKDEIIYKGLIKRLEALKLGKINNDDGTVTNLNDGVYIIINGKNIKTVKDVEEIPEDKFNNISKKTAQTILHTLGYISEDTNSTRPGMKDRISTDRLVGQLSNNYRILKLLEKSGVAVEVEFNSTDDVKDHWISGPITNVTKAEDGTISYDVDCAKTGAIKGKYRFTGQKSDSNADKNDNSTYKAKVLDNNGGTVNEDIVFKFQDEKKPLLNSTGAYRTSKKASA